MLFPKSEEARHDPNPQYPAQPTKAAERGQRAGNGVCEWKSHLSRAAPAWLVVVETGSVLSEEIFVKTARGSEWFFPLAP